MIISDRLCFIHLPKTGGAFVRKYLTENVPGAKLYKGSHWHYPVGKLKEIGKKQSIIGIVRNPLSWYVSFFYDNRRMTPITQKAARKAGKEPRPTDLMEYFDSGKSENFVVFLNNLFEEIEAGNPPDFSYNTIDLNYEIMKKYDIGILTMIYMYMYFPEYDQLLERDIDIFELHDDLFGLDYVLNQDNLNEDLVNLLNILYPEFAGFEIHEKYSNVNVTKREHWSNYYTKDLIERVRYKDRMLYEKYYFS